MKPCRSTSRVSVVAVAVLLWCGSARAEEVPFSASAAALSDTTITVGVLTPVALQLGNGATEDDDLLLYGEALGINLALNLTAKYAFKRPRPYTRIQHPRVARYAASRSDTFLSFYSGHSSMAFTAAVSGSLLFDGEEVGHRATVWGFNMAMAGATANLRVRAGKHYVSDVVAGAIIGTAIGIAVPALQSDVEPPTGAEWAAIGGGLLVGVVGSQLIPVKRDILEPLDAVTPVAYQGGGGGLVVAGSF